MIIRKDSLGRPHTAKAGLSRRCRRAALSPPLLYNSSLCIFVILHFIDYQDVLLLQECQMLRFSSKYGIWGCSLHFVILSTSGFTGISDLTKMYSDIWDCVVIRRGTFTPHRECPALRIVSGRQVQLLPDRRREGYAAVSDFRGMFADSHFNNYRTLNESL